MIYLKMVTMIFVWTMILGLLLLWPLVILAVGHDGCQREHYERITECEWRYEIAIGIGATLALVVWLAGVWFICMKMFEE